MLDHLLTVSPAGGTKHEIFDDSPWTEEQHMPTARLGLDAVSLDGKIYAIGGKINQTKQSSTNVNEIFVPN
jgi:hypothetical protein